MEIRRKRARCNGEDYDYTTTACRADTTRVSIVLRRGTYRDRAREGPGSALIVRCV